MGRKYEKLVRDLIPEIIRKNSEEPVTRVLNNEEYWEKLVEKDREELEEVRSAITKEECKMELADKFEVLLAMIEYQGFTLNEIQLAAEEKRKRNGGFTKRLFLEKVISKQDTSK